MAKKASIFARITKVDEGARTVIGRACQEISDRTDEILDYNTSKPFFQEWVRSSSEASVGKSLGNVRTMHGSVAAGKLTGIEFNDAERAVDVKAKVVDDKEWEKVLEGVYTGFSIGGKYVNKWEDPDDRKFTRYTAQPFEISLVDSPCIPTAVFFDVIKKDGSVVQKSFAVQQKAPPQKDDLEVAGSPDDIEALAKAMNGANYSVADVVKLVGEVKKKTLFADPSNQRFPLTTKDQIRASWYFANQSNTASMYDEDQLKQILKQIGEAWKQTIDEEGPPLEAEKITTHQLRKSFYSCSQLAMVVDGLTRLVSATEYEYINSEENAGIAVKFRKAVNDLANVLGQMCDAAKEAFNKEPDEDDAPGIMALAVQVRDLAKATKIEIEDLIKVGSRHNKMDLQRVQDIHDMAVQLSAQCGNGRSDAMSKDEVDARKAVGEKRSSKPYDDPSAEESAGRAKGGAQGADVTAKRKDSDDDDDASKRKARRDADDDSDSDSDAHKRKAKKDSDADYDDDDTKKRKMSDPDEDDDDDDDDSKKSKKSLTVGTLRKALNGNLEAFQEIIEAAVEAGVNSATKPLMKRIQQIESVTPVPGKGVLKVIGKGDDVGDGAQKGAVEPILQNDGKVNEVATELKKVFQKGGRPLFKFGQ